jgi:hypothetical protein
MEPTGGPEKKEGQQGMSTNSMIAFGIACGTVRWIVLVIWG